MNSRKPTIAFLAALGLVALDLFINRSLPVVSLSIGGSFTVPSWLQILVANGAAIGALLALAELSRFMKGEVPIASWIAFGLAGVTLLAPIAAPHSAAPIVLFGGLVAILLLIPMLIFTHRIPLPALQAMFWLSLISVFSLTIAIVPAGAPIALLESLRSTQEGVVLLGICAASLGWLPRGGRVSLSAVATGLGVAAGFALAYAHWGEAVASVALSGFGVAMSLPIWTYCLTVFLVSCCLFSLVQVPGGRVRAAALALLLAGGFSFAQVHLVPVAVLGLLALASDYPLSSKRIASSSPPVPA